MDERDWTILLALYETNSITKAAEMSFMSQPTLTSRLQQIEDRFGAQVVIRGRKGVIFTPEGKYLVECAQEMIRRIHIIEGRIRTIQNEVKGSLRIGASNFFTGNQLPELLCQFRNIYPNIEFYVTTNLSAKIVDLVTNYDVDVGFIRGDYKWVDKKDLLYVETMNIVYNQKFEIDNLPLLPRIDYMNNNSVKYQLDTWWKDRFSQAPLIGMVVDRVNSCKEMVLRGLGYAFLPDGVLEESDNLFKLAMLGQNDQPLIRRTWMLYHEDNLQIALIKAFVDFVNKVNVYAL